MESALMKTFKVIINCEVNYLAQISTSLFILKAMPALCGLFLIRWWKLILRSKIIYLAIVVKWLTVDLFLKVTNLSSNSAKLRNICVKVF